MAFGGGSALFQLVALGLPAAGSVEAPIPIRIVFDAPPDCSTVEAFYQGVRSRTDRVRRAETGETGTELGVRVTKTAGKVHGELNLTGEHGESDRRAVSGETCDEVVEALSLTAALALDPTARVSPAPVPPAPAPPVRPAEPCPPPPPPPEIPTSFELGVHAHAAMAKVVSPDVSFGGNLGLTLAPVEAPKGPSIRVALGYLGNDLVSNPDTFATHLTLVSASVCPIHFNAEGSFFVIPCLVGRGGFLEARGLGVSNPAWAVRTYFSVGFEPVLALVLGAGFRAEVAPTLDFPLVKRSFVTGRPPRPAGETVMASPALSAGIGYHFQ